jgi:hypothetical protein
MKPAEIRFNKKAFIKEKSAEDFINIRPSPILWEHFKIPRQLVQLLAIQEQNAIAGMKFVHSAIVNSFM